MDATHEYDSLDFEDQLRVLLKASGRPPKDIGEAAGVDFSQIYKFLSGKAELRSGTISKLCSWLGAHLIRKEGQGPLAEQVLAGIGEDRKREARDLVRRLAEILG